MFISLKTRFSRKQIILNYFLRLAEADANTICDTYDRLLSKNGKIDKDYPSSVEEVIFFILNEVDELYSKRYFIYLIYVLRSLNVQT